MQTDQTEPKFLTRKEKKRASWASNFQRVAEEQRARADRAEQSVRDVTKDRNEWRRRALLAESKLTAMGGL